MLPQWIIEKKRDGHALTEHEIRFFVNGYSEENIPDYQMAALAMAIYFQGMTLDETAALTNAMMHSGSVIDTSCVSLPKVDKHSTGGVGDKVSLVFAPLAACCGLAVPMISGRSLGITGGTLDKLESIPGYRTDLSPAEFLDVVQKCGCSISGQTAELAPADGKLYALRDVTGTVQSIPLIAASIMSKKLAEGIDALVLDVKCGKGAFMRTGEDARELAHTMVEIGRRMNKATAAIVTDMNQPLGRSAGNAVEVIEAIDTLRGRGARDLLDVTLELASCALVLGGRAADKTEASGMMLEHINDGSAFHKFKEMVRLHGGNAAAVEDTTQLPAARIRSEYPAREAGYVAQVDAELIGKACVVLGAGRTKVEDGIDPAVGITGILKTGDHVEKGEPLLTIHANKQERLEQAGILLDEAFRFSSERPPAAKLIGETIRGE